MTEAERAHWLNHPDMRDVAARLAGVSYVGSRGSRVVQIEVAVNICAEALAAERARWNTPKDRAPWGPK